MPEDVLQNHDGIVDQSRECEREPTQDHDVHGAVASGECDKSGQYGQWNRQEHGRSRPQASQEDQDHDTREQQPDQSLVNQVSDGGADELRLVEHDLCDELLWHIQQMRHP